MSHILNLLLDLKRSLAEANGPVILILVVRESVPAPADYFLNCLQATLPAILDCCEQLLVVVEGSASDRAPLRAALKATRRTPTKHVPAQTFDSPGDAFAHAQPLAPQDVLELQRRAMRQSLPPSGRFKIKDK